MIFAPKRKSSKMALVDFKGLFKNLEKSKHEAEPQIKALRELMSAFIRNIATGMSPIGSKGRSYRQTLSRVERWYENERRFIENCENKTQLILASTLGTSASSLCQILESRQNIDEVIAKARKAQEFFTKFKGGQGKDFYSAICLYNNNQPREALECLNALLKSHGKTKITCPITQLLYDSAVRPMLKLKGDCHFELREFFEAIENYTKAEGMDHIFEDVDISFFKEMLKEALCHMEGMEGIPGYALVKMMCGEIGDYLSQFDYENFSDDVIQLQRGLSYYHLGYYAEAKSDLKIIQNLCLQDTLRRQQFLRLDELCHSFLYCKRFKHALLCVFKGKVFIDEYSTEKDLVNQSCILLLAKCLYKNKRFLEAHRFCEKLNADILTKKALKEALELNGHCLTQLKHYEKALDHFEHAFLFASSKVQKLNVAFAIYKLAFYAQDMEKCKRFEEHMKRPKFYANASKLLKCEDFNAEAMKFTLEKSVEKLELSSSPSTENVTHLVFCNSAMIALMFKNK